MQKLPAKLRPFLKQLKKRFQRKSSISNHDNQDVGNNHHWVENARDDLEAWISDVLDHISEEQRVDTAARLLIGAARIGFKDEKTKLELFDYAQKFGVHFLPVHFYSPVPNTSDLPDGIFEQRYDELPNLKLNKQKISSILNDLSIFGPEFENIPMDYKKHKYYWNNAAFGGGDASLLYSMLRKYQSNNIIEIGSGFSTMIGLEAIKKNNHGQYTCIEPYPNEDIKYFAKKGFVNLIESPVQSLPLETFDVLNSGDVLFIDSTHVCKTGSDVVHEILKIIPRLNPGVLIHVHDIFFPFNYPKSWVVEKQIFWNEGYLLYAFLAFNNAFEMLIPNQVFILEEYGELFKSAFPHSPVCGGGSFWFRRLE